MNCSKCVERVQQNDSFCSQCGEPLSETDESEEDQTGEPVSETNEPDDTQIIETAEKVIKNKKGQNMKKSWKQWFVLGLMFTFFIFFLVSGGVDPLGILYVIAMFWLGAEFIKWVAHT